MSAFYGVSVRSILRDRVDKDLGRSSQGGPLTSCCCLPGPSCSAFLEGHLYLGNLCLSGSFMDKAHVQCSRVRGKSAMRERGGNLSSQGKWPSVVFFH
eukprot:1134675-Pelagomonas_calceolata.AAC.1